VLEGDSPAMLLPDEARRVLHTTRRAYTPDIHHFKIESRLGSLRYVRAA
jgi:hypothetical protein